MSSSKDIEREGDAIDAGWEVLAGEANRVMPGSRARARNLARNSHYRSNSTSGGNRDSKAVPVSPS
jgi:hypothetical protein